MHCCMLTIVGLLSLTGMAPAFYDANLGRWVNRDPINEHGFNLLARSVTSRDDNNLYRFVANDPISRIDPYGLTDQPWPVNGRVHVSKCCPPGTSIRSINLDDGTVYTTTSGGSTPWSDDVDFVQCQGTWYKVGGSG